MQKNEKQNQNFETQSNVLTRILHFFKSCASHVSSAKEQCSKVHSNLWDNDLDQIPFLKRHCLRLARIVVLVAHGFKKDDCALHASSLTFTSLLSFVPILALAISVVRAVSYDASMRDDAKAFVRSMVVEIPALDKFKKTPAVLEQSLTSTNGLSATEISITEIDASEATPLTSTHTVVSAESSDISVESGITLETIEKWIDLGFDKVEQFNFGALGGIGLLMFVWLVICVLGSVESAFNRVWGVVINRPLARKFTDYLSVLIICPLLGVAASSLPMMGVFKSHMDQADKAFFLSTLAGVNVIKVVWVLFLLTLTFMFLLRFTPNTHVRLRPGIVGGFVCAVGIMGWLKVCLLLQIGVAKYSAFFGSFAMVPIILSWVYVSWSILLFGAEVSYAIQNVDTYYMGQGGRHASQKGRLLLGVAILRDLAESIQTGKGIFDVLEFSSRFHIPSCLVQSVIQDLTECDILVRVTDESDAYATRRNLSELTVGNVVRVLMTVGGGEQDVGLGELATSKNVDTQFVQCLDDSLSIPILSLPLNAFGEQNA